MALWASSMLCGARATARAKGRRARGTGDW